MLKIAKIIALSLCFSSAAFAGGHGWGHHHHHHGHGYNPYYGGGAYYVPQGATGYYPARPPYFAPLPPTPYTYGHVLPTPMHGHGHRDRW